MAYSNEEIDDDLPNYFFNVTKLKKINKIKYKNINLGILTYHRKVDGEDTLVRNAEPQKIREFIYETELKFEEINKLLNEFKKYYENNIIPITYPVIIDYINEYINEYKSRINDNDLIKRVIEEKKNIDEPLNKLLIKNELLSIEDIENVRNYKGGQDECNDDLIKGFMDIINKINRDNSTLNYAYKNVIDDPQINELYKKIFPDENNNPDENNKNGGKKSRKRKHNKLKKKRKSTRKKRRKSNKKHR